MYYCDLLPGEICIRNFARAFQRLEAKRLRLEKVLRGIRIRICNNSSCDDLTDQRSTDQRKKKSQTYFFIKKKKSGFRRECLYVYVYGTPHIVIKKSFVPRKVTSRSLYRRREPLWSAMLHKLWNFELELNSVSPKPRPRSRTDFRVSFTYDVCTRVACYLVSRNHDVPNESRELRHRIWIDRKRERFWMKRRWTFSTERWLESVKLFGWNNFKTKCHISLVSRYLKVYVWINWKIFLYYVYLYKNIFTLCIFI